MGRPDTSVVSFRVRSSHEKTLNILDIGDYMKNKTSRKWGLAVLEKPAGLHYAVTMANLSTCQEFSSDLINAVQSEKKRIAEGGVIGDSSSAVVYGSAARVPKVLMNEVTVEYLNMCY